MGGDIRGPSDGGSKSIGQLSTLQRSRLTLAPPKVQCPAAKMLVRLKRDPGIGTDKLQARPFTKALSVLCCGLAMLSVIGLPVSRNN